MGYPHKFEKQRLAMTTGTVLGVHIQVLKIETCTPHECREVMEKESKAHLLALLHGEDYLGAAFVEQLFLKKFNGASTSFSIFSYLAIPLMNSKIRAASSRTALRMIVFFFSISVSIKAGSTNLYRFIEPACDYTSCFTT
jgi:hypothetical protein